MNPLNLLKYIFCGVLFCVVIPALASNPEKGKFIPQTDSPARTNTIHCFGKFS